MPNPNISKVYLLDVPLENDYKNTLYFTSKENQQAYFQNRIKKSYIDFSYQRKDFKIRVPDHIDNIYGCNYVMYQNSAYSNKWFYAFITKMEYIDDGRTDVFIETDCIQTWYFDYEVKASFIDREHTNDDTIGSNLIDEGLELGEYKANSTYVDSNMADSNSDLCYIIGSTVGYTVNSQNDLDAAGSGIYNGLYSGVKYFRFDDVNSIDIMLEILDNHAKKDAVTGIFIAPKVLAPRGQELEAARVAQSNAPYSYNILRDKFFNTHGLDQYVPKNNKLKTFPYCYLAVSNNQGGDVVYRYEDFMGVPMTFTVMGVLCPGCSVKLIPEDYRGVGYNWAESLNLGKFPTCNWASDMYTNWLTQNSVNLATNLISGGLQVAGGVAGTVASVATGGALAGVVGMSSVAGITNGLLSITNTLAEKRKASLVPPQANGNLNVGDVVTAGDHNAFTFYDMSIKREMAEVIDNYFTMFGYKCNKVKVPNNAHRERWWYTKTIDANIIGDVANNDMQIIKNAYNNGITFWRNASEIGNYSLSNNIV